MKKEKLIEKLVKRNRKPRSQLPKKKAKESSKNSDLFTTKSTKLVISVLVLKV